MVRTSNDSETDSSGFRDTTVSLIKTAPGAIKSEMFRSMTMQWRPLCYIFDNYKKYCNRLT